MNTPDESSAAPHDPGTIEQTPWGTADGAPITLFILRAGPYEARVTTYGGVLVSLLAPDREGRLADIVLGHDALDPYRDRGTSPYFGALIGRHANRIARGRFTLDGTEVRLATNNGPNALHGGPGGFDQVVWQGEGNVVDGEPRLTLTYVSPDGEEGYPGTLTTRVTYTLTRRGELRLDYHATTDAPTVVNLTNHTYWNLSGATTGILDHELVVDADAITPIDETLIPTGELRPVDGTPFDFRQARPIGERVDADDDQLRFAGGYDHNFVLNGTPGTLRKVATLRHPGSGRAVDVLTTQPGMQVYSGNFLDGSITGKGGQRYDFRWAACLETQHFPDTPNQPNFPPTTLRPGEVFESTTVYVLRAE